MRGLVKIVAPLVVLCLSSASGVSAGAAQKLAAGIKNVPSGKWVEIQSAGIGGRAFSKVNYAPNVNALVSWGTSMHGKKKYTYPVGFFNLANGQWEEGLPPGMKQDPKGTYGRSGSWHTSGVTSFFEWKGIKRPRGVTTFRMSAWDAGKKRIVYFAGITFAYDPAKRIWTELKPKIAPPRGLQAASMCYDADNKRMILFGGFGVHSPEGRAWTWYFDCATNEWSKPAFGPKLLGELRYKIKAAGTRSTTLRRDAQYIMGLQGAQKSKAEKQLRLDIEALTRVVAGLSGTVRTEDEKWLELDKQRFSAAMKLVSKALGSLKRAKTLSGPNLVSALETAEEAILYRATEAASTQPQARCFTSLVYDKKNKSAVLFGGNRLDTALGDTWMLDSKANRWIRVETQASPPAQQGHAMCYLPGAKVVFLASRSGNWVFDLAKKEWTPVAGAIPAFRGHRTLSINAISEDDIVVGVLDRIYNSRITYAYKLPSPIAPVKHKPTPVASGVPQSKTHKYSRKWYDDLPAPKPDVFAATLKSLPENKWTPIQTEKEARARTWGSCTYDSKRRELIYWGGGHSGNINNNVDHFSMRTGRWSRNRDSSFKPAPFLRKVRCPNGRTYYNEPWLMHARKTYAYDTISGMVIMTQISGYTPLYVHYTWIYDPRSGEWDQFKPVEKVPAAGHSGQVVGTPHGFMFLVGGQLWHLDVKDRKWSKLGKKQNRKQMPDRERDSIVYDSKRDRLIFMAKNIHYFDFKTRVWTKAGNLSQSSREAVYVPSQDAVLALDRIVKGVAHFRILLCDKEKLIDGPVSPFKGSNRGISEHAMTIDPQTETILWIDAHGFTGVFTLKALKLNVKTLSKE
jgi:Galactose oxidase, central domain